METQALTELKLAYKVKKLAFDKAKAEEEKYKKALKEAMAEAREDQLTDDEGYTYTRGVQERNKFNEEALLAELKARGLTECISTKEVINEDATVQAVQDGKLPQEVLQENLTVTEVVTLTLKAPKKSK